MRNRDFLEHAAKQATVDGTKPRSWNLPASISPSFRAVSAQARRDRRRRVLSGTNGRVLAPGTGTFLAKLHPRGMPIPLPEPDFTPDDPPGRRGRHERRRARRQCRAGDHGAFELIMRRHNRRLFRLARSIWSVVTMRPRTCCRRPISAPMRSSARARATATALRRGWRGSWRTRRWAGCGGGPRRFAPGTNGGPAGRGGRPGSSSLPRTSGPERLAASSELRRLLEAAVDDLPRIPHRVRAARGRGLDTAETAACLGLRPETVKTRLHRARRLLQESWPGGCSPVGLAVRVPGQALRSRRDAQCWRGRRATPPPSPPLRL